MLKVQPHHHMIIIFQALQVHVNVMMPLTTLNNNGTITDRNFLVSAFQKLKSVGTNGIMLDVWWGIAEPQAGKYNFDGYYQVFQLAKEAKLHVQPVMSFHRCGGNVGDDCDIPLPKWVHEIAVANRYYYEDQLGNRQDEYLSWAANNQKAFPGPSGTRTPLQMYGDFMNAFATKMRTFIDSKTIDDIQIGGGPCGELRYPSYPSKHWQFPGVGMFQAFDPLMKQAFQNAVKEKGQNYTLPTDAGTYNSKPNQTQFFKIGFKSESGRFFLNWYSSTLIAHAKQVLALAQTAFPTTKLSMKVAGIHWWYGQSNHAAELTAGYYNANGRNAYEDLAMAFGKRVTFDFTCLEMTNAEQVGSNADCQPEQLVRQVFDAVRMFNSRVSGENALARYDRYAYDQMLSQIRYAKGNFDAITYLRLTKQLLNNEFAEFTRFVKEAGNVH